MSKDTINPVSNITQDKIISEAKRILTESIKNRKIYMIDFTLVKSIFYDVTLNKDENVTKVKINHRGFIDVINEFGIFKHLIDTGFVFILIQNNIISEITINDIQTIFQNYLDTLPDDIKHEKTTFKKKYLISDIYFNNTSLFTKNKLSLLPSSNIELNKDTKNKSYIYYRNGFVECSPEGYKLKGLNDLKGQIWKSQIKERDFINLGFNDISDQLLDSVTVAKFYYHIANSDINRLNSLCSYAGYLLHDFFEIDLKALILTDSKISDVAEGRTGKGLFVNTLSQVRKTVNIDGKTFDLTSAFKYQTVDLSTKIVHLEDTKKGFDIESIFNDITTGIKVEYKGKTSFSAKSKMVLSCNKTINIQGSSARGRIEEFELSEFYSDTNTPEKVFGHRFFTDWDKLDEWTKFDNFMMFCICLYLKKGMIAAPQINLAKRKVMDNTCPEFSDWIDEKELKCNIEHDKKELHLDFLNQYEEFKNDKKHSTSTTFVRWLKTWASAQGWKIKHERPTNGKRLIEFSEKS